MHTGSAASASESSPQRPTNPEPLDHARLTPLLTHMRTGDQPAAATIQRDIDAGQAAVNLPTSGWDVHHPFGGFKLSGSPFKEQGLHALAFYTRIKTCAVRSR